VVELLVVVELPVSVTVEFDDVLVEFELSHGGSAATAVLLLPSMVELLTLVELLEMIVELSDETMVPSLAIQAGGGGAVELVSPEDVILAPAGGGGGGNVEFAPAGGAGGTKLELASGGDGGADVELVSGGAMLASPPLGDTAVGLDCTGAARAPCPRRTAKRKIEVIFDSILLHLYIRIQRVKRTGLVEEIE